MRIQRNTPDTGYEKMPILFCIFNKLDTTPKVFNAIRKSKPKKLYLSSDGWREIAGEREKVMNLREFIQQNIDWDCEVFTLFHDRNLGCKAAMEAAIDWFFNCEEAGIILEDDTLPAQPFFRFCSELLLKYRDCKEVGLISGYAGNTKTIRANTYCFREEPNTWGWASWRRAWRQHDRSRNIGWYEQKISAQSNDLRRIYMRGMLPHIASIIAGEHLTWDIPWWFWLVCDEQLCVVPECNLITNIGVGVSEAFTTDFEYDLGGNIPAGDFSFPIAHPNTASGIAAKQLSDEEFVETYIKYTDNFVKKERACAGKILTINNLFAKDKEIPLADRQKIMREVESENVYAIFSAALKFSDFAKAQKYLYLALTKSLFSHDREKDICYNCRKCLAICSSKSFGIFANECGDKVLGINKNTCEYCFKCMKSCPFVNPK